MKKKYPTSKKARSANGYKKHLKPYGKRQANKATRKISAEQLENYGQG